MKILQVWGICLRTFLLTDMTALTLINFRHSRVRSYYYDRNVWWRETIGTVNRPYLLPQPIFLEKGDTLEIIISPENNLANNRLSQLIFAGEEIK